MVVVDDLDMVVFPDTDAGVGGASAFMDGRHVVCCCGIRERVGVGKRGVSRLH